MGFMGVLAPVAQAGQAAASSAPSGVSVATSSSGNYDDAFGTQAYDDGAFQSQIHLQQGSVFSSNTGETQLDITTLNNYSAGSSMSIRISAYLRATGATSQSWTLSDLTDSGLLSFVHTLNTTSMSTAQDSTFANSSHLGGFVVISAGGGRGGLTWGDDGDWIQFKVKGTATNNVGSTNSDQITLKIVWTGGDPGD